MARACALSLASVEDADSVVLGSVLGVAAGTPIRISSMWGGKSSMRGGCEGWAPAMTAHGSAGPTSP